LIGILIAPGDGGGNNELRVIWGKEGDRRSSARVELYHELRRGGRIFCFMPIGKSARGSSNARNDLGEPVAPVRASLRNEKKSPRKR